jgi:hypothetical protein
MRQGSDIMKKSDKEKKKKAVARPTVQYVSLTLLSAVLCAVTAMLFILIAGSKVAAVISLFCAAVLCLIPAAAAKLYISVRKLKEKNVLCALCFFGFLLSLPLSLSYYVSHDYDLSVYRYMKKTQADDYYFAGYENYLEDYGGAEDFMRQMKAAPASIVLENMSEDKLSRLSAEELKTINSESLWDYCGFDDILGSTAEEVEQSMKAASEMTTYDFTFGYRSLHAKTLGYMFAHPRLMIGEVGMMIKQPTEHSVRFVTLVIFWLGQLLAVRMILTGFELDEENRIIYIHKPHIKRRNKQKED